MTNPLFEQLKIRGEGRLPGHLGVEVVSASPDRIEGRLKVRDEIMAPNGFLHAASVIGLLDTLSGYGTVANLPEGASGFTTVELKSNFMGTLREGVLLGEATPVHRGRTTQVWDARAYREDGKTLALFRCTQMILWPKG